MITATNGTIQKRIEAALVAYLRAKFITLASEHLDISEIGTVGGWSETTGTDHGDTLDTFTIELTAPIAQVFPGDCIRVDSTDFPIRLVNSQSDTLLSVQTIGGTSAGDASIIRSSRIRLSDDTATREGLPWLCVVQASNLTESWPSANAFKGTLFIGLDGGSNLIEPDETAALTETERQTNLASHDTRAAFLASVLADAPTVGTFVHNSALSGVEDITLVALLATAEPGSNAEMGCFTYLHTRAIVVNGESPS